MMITVSQMAAVGVAAARAQLFVEPFNSACSRFEIASPLRMAAFLAQCLVESDMLTALEEDFTYSASGLAGTFHYYASRPDEAAGDGYVRDPVTRAFTKRANVEAIANKAYADRNGNGGADSGDGWNYRGRGLIQLTGRANYADAAESLARPYVNQPELVAQPADACLTAAWYWHTHKCNALADAGAIDAVTRAINGPPMLKATVRKQYTQQALAMFNRATGA